VALLGALSWIVLIRRIAPIDWKADPQKFQPAV